MKSIKPGRGPSMMSGVVGIFMIGFGVVWTVIAGALFPLMAIFGILWTAIAASITVYNFKNATGKNRYSSYDIVDSHEEPDPLNERYGATQTQSSNDSQKVDEDSNFCPYCGTAVSPEFEYCNKCGKKLP